MKILCTCLLYIQLSLNHLRQALLGPLGPTPSAVASFDPKVSETSTEIPFHLATGGHGTQTHTYASMEPWAKKQLRCPFGKRASSRHRLFNEFAGGTRVSERGKGARRSPRERTKLQSGLRMYFSVLRTGHSTTQTKQTSKRNNNGSNNGKK